MQSYAQVYTCKLDLIVLTKRQNMKQSRNNLYQYLLPYIWWHKAILGVNVALEYEVILHICDLYHVLHGNLIGNNELLLNNFLWAFKSKIAAER